MTSPALTVADLDDARRLLAGVAVTTPVEHSRALSELTGTEVHLKCENLQRTGSFKLRGAYVRLSRLTADERASGVVAASAGNHAQGVALAARELGIHAVVYMPSDAALPKVAATRAYGAEVRLVGQSVEDALAAAYEHARVTGAVLIHPFDHVDVVAGQATIALEILEQVPDVRTVLVPVGGGGLAAGMVAAFSQLAPHVHVVGVQAERMAAYPGSLRTGVAETVPVRSTMADGIAVARPGVVPLELLRHGNAEVVTVSEDEISRALLLVAERAKLIVEPAAATGVAALMAEPDGFDGPVVVVLSGGNVDPVVLLRVVRHGLASAGRYLQVRALLTDRPGMLADILLAIAREGGNVMHIEHVRTGPHLAIDEVEVVLQVETKGAEHQEALLEHLRAEGYRLAPGV
ncbi:threonine ammonia-lyase [Sanguibacter sp. HDW7]|uniref:threonine ammonia-lyase n=1 Tax=Sanguibacter sp. HDW7 TaxID=2714931 RepID=UPI00140CB82C|nr:threonine ammonia-lyase [Sanguibacter sp. HDW7]QIK84163.1 threonine ammonia-lyase [Sanguibacter sp. HDW7]